MRRILGFMVLVGTAHAQTTSDLQPAPPAPPAGAAAPYYPGMPAPQPTTPTLTPPGGAPAPAGRAGYIIRDDYVPREPMGAEGEAPPSAATGTHVVKKGDTLWDISAFYFKNPWYWPKLWALNTAITNPHWIYPGDVIRLSVEEAAAAEPPPPPMAAPKEEALPKFIGRALPPGAGLNLRQTGFVEPGELDTAGTVIGSKEEKVMLATLDEAYVKFEKKAPMRVGQKYTVYKPIRTVRHPETGKRLGDIVEIYGEVEVKSVTDANIAKVLITDSIEPIERGWRVGPLRKQFKMVQPRRGDRDMTGVVVATIRPVELVGSEMLVFLDKGKKEGVEIGNRFVIVRRGDGYAPINWRKGPIDDKRYPREVIGDVLIIDLREGLSTGVVLGAAKESRVGDRVEMRRGD